MDDDMYKLHLVPRKGQNVTSLKENATMVKPGMSTKCLEGNSGDYDVCTGHQINGDDAEETANPGIVIQLVQPFLLNRLCFRLCDKTEEGETEPRSYSYYVEVSLDQQNWTRVCDRTKYLCRSWQYIVFPTMVAKYIRIAGTYSTLNNRFDVAYVNAHLSKNNDVIDKTFEPSGLLVPRSNVATPCRGACVYGAIKPQYMLNGNSTNYDEYTYHVISSGGIYIQLGQPVVLSSMRFLLWDKDDRRYGFMIYVSTDKTNWTCVANRKNKRSWQIVEFKPLPVLFIKLMGTANTKNEDFHIVHFECPSTVNPDEMQANPENE